MVALEAGKWAASSWQGALRAGMRPVSGWSVGAVVGRLGRGTRASKSHLFR
jgi:hypothetical protein